MAIGNCSIEPDHTKIFQLQSTENNRKNELNMITTHTDRNDSVLKSIVLHMLLLLSHIIFTLYPFALAKVLCKDKRGETCRNTLTILDAFSMLCFVLTPAVYVAANKSIKKLLFQPPTGISNA